MLLRSFDTVYDQLRIQLEPIGNAMAETEQVVAKLWDACAKQLQYLQLNTNMVDRVRYLIAQDGTEFRAFHGLDV